MSARMFGARSNLFPVNLRAAQAIAVAGPNRKAKNLLCKLVNHSISLQQIHKIPTLKAKPNKTFTQHLAETYKKALAFRKFKKRGMNYVQKITN